MTNILTRSTSHDASAPAVQRLGRARLASRTASAPAISSVSLALAHAAWLFMPRSQHARRTLLHYRALKLAAVALTVTGALVVAMQDSHAAGTLPQAEQTAALVPPDTAAPEARTPLTSTPTLAEPVATTDVHSLTTDGVLSSEESPPVPASTEYTEARPTAPQPDPAFIPRRPVIGDATEKLLALQREQTGPARPISGTEAALSYARYLKSFEHPIPEKYESNVNEIKSNRGR